MATVSRLINPTTVSMGKTAKAAKLTGQTEDPESGTVSPRSPPTSPSVSDSSKPTQSADPFKDRLFKSTVAYGVGRKHRTRKHKRHSRKTKKHLRRK